MGTDESTGQAQGPTPEEILERGYQRAVAAGNRPIIENPDIVSRIDYACRCKANRSGRRYLLACSLAKLHNPGVDIRKPTVEIEGPDHYSGRGYDERIIGPFARLHDLPVNSTTAFLTPAYRNQNRALTPDIEVIGRPKQLYRTLLLLLDDVFQGRVSPSNLLAETLRQLVIIHEEESQDIANALRKLRESGEHEVPLSAEAIVTLIHQHLASRNASRLPVLVVAAAYNAAQEHLGERALPLQSHNAADKQTGALGDVEVVLIGDNKVVTVYEMKDKRVAIEDLDTAIVKVTKFTSDTGKRIDNYIFITTEDIEAPVQEYAASLYDRTSGIEFVILDCIGFLRHFLHLFHRLRIQFLDAYQDLVLAEPASAVSHPLKKAFLALREVAESGSDEDATEDDV